jgi:hypothetical protein
MARVQTVIVIPAKAGIHCDVWVVALDPRFRGEDDEENETNRQGAKTPRDFPQ